VVDLVGVGRGLALRPLGRWRRGQREVGLGLVVNGVEAGDLPSANQTQRISEPAQRISDASANPTQHLICQWHGRCRRPAGERCGAFSGFRRNHLSSYDP
jgi:hypothetical protein